MAQFLVLIISFVTGLLCQKNKSFPKSTGHSLNLFIIYVSLPALILVKVPRMISDLDLNGDWWIPVSMMWFAFFLAVLLVFIIGKAKKWPAPTMGALMLTVGLGNTSFVGFPILEALIGPEAIPIGILADQPGSFLLVSTLGIVIASSFSGDKVTVKTILRRLFTFPPFLTIIFSLFWSLLGVPGEEIVTGAMTPIAATLVPLALFAVGFQTKVNWEVLIRRRSAIGIGLFLKLFLIPLVCWLLFWKALGKENFYTQVSLLEVAMATQITSAVVAAEFDVDPELAQLMVTLSVPLSLITVPLWHYWL